MINTNTHILCEPYEIENYLSKKDINISTFVQKVDDLIKSLKNSNYDEIDKYEKLDGYTTNNAMSIDIPDSFYSCNINKVYQYSNRNELKNLLKYLNENVNEIFNLNIKIHIEDVKEYVKKLHEIIINVETCDIPNSNKNDFYKFEDITSFKSVIEICNNSFYSELIEWITLFPNKLLDIQIESTKNIISKSNIKIDDNISDVNEIKKELIYLIYTLYESIIKNIVDTKIFWCAFLDMLEPETDVDTISFIDDESDLNLLLNDLDLDDYIDPDEYAYGDESLDDPIFSFEDNLPIKAKKNNSFKKSIDTLRKLPSRINKIRKEFKLFRMRSKNHAFYMKYMGRIEGLYERYSDEAKIVENGMKGDPVEILKNEGHEYISNISNEFVNLQHELINISKKFASSGNPKEMITLLKHFGGMYMNDTVKSNSITHNFIISCRFKIGEIILKNNKIYGYTSESIAENGKFPPSNHAIVSLFVDKPDEKPYEQSVSDIFKNTDSFKLIAKNEKEPIFEVASMCSDLLTKGIQEDSYKMIKEYRKQSTEKFKLTINELTAKSNEPKKEKRKLTKQFKHSWKALLAGYDYFIKNKSYISDLIESYFVMMTRIDNLCKECIVSLLHTETMHRDERYNTGFKADNINSHRRYTQKTDDSDVKTKGERQLEKIQHLDERTSEYSERRKDINNHINEIKNAMRLKNI